MTKRIDVDHCCGIIIDVQEFFLAQIGHRERAQIVTNTANFARLIGYFDIPIVVTLEKPVSRKGGVPAEIDTQAGASAGRFEKSFFDLTKEPRIRDGLKRLKRKQAIIAGCETDVCVLQSCLGLLDLGYDVFVIEELLFSSARNVASAVARMQAEGAVFLSYKSLYYELIEAVAGDSHGDAMEERFGPFPDDLPDCAVEWPYVKKASAPKAPARGMPRPGRPGRDRP